MRRIAVCPGSFDPVTLGHLDIITRASKLFDKVIVLISRNAGKSQPSFTATERMLMIESVTETPDTVITLSNGHTYIVRESMKELQNKILEYNRRRRRFGRKAAADGQEPLT